MYRVSDGPARGYGGMGVSIVMYGVVEVVFNDDGSNELVAIDVMRVVILATGEGFVQGERNEVGFVGTYRDTSCAYMVLTEYIPTETNGIFGSQQKWSACLFYKI